MGKIAFSADNKKNTGNFDYPKLKLTQNERARILLLEDPVMEYVHTLRAPIVQDGKPVMTTEKRRNGDEYETNKMDFLSRPICIGDETILANDGSDPKNCPMCALAKSNPDMAQAPQRRFAMHVIRYRTKPNSFDAINPFSVETLVWAFTDTIFNKIVDFKEQWNDLRQHDLTLGPCTNVTFQKAELNIAAKALWLESKETQTLTAMTFKENQIPDLSIACGSVKERRWIDEDIKTIKDRWALVSQSDTDTSGVTGEVGGSLSAGLDELLNSNAGTKTTEEEWAKEAPSTEGEGISDDLDSLLNVSASTDSGPDIDSLLNGDTEAEPEADEPEPEPAKIAKKAPAKKPAAKPEPEPEPEPDADDAPDDAAPDLDDLLKGII